MTGATLEVVIDVTVVFPCEAEGKLDTGGVQHGGLQVTMRSSTSTSYGGSLVFTNLNAWARYQVGVTCEAQGWSYEGHTHFTATPGKRRQVTVEIPLVERRVRFETEAGELLADTQVTWGCGMLTQTGKTDAAGHLDLTLVAGQVSFGREAADLVDTS